MGVSLSKGQTVSLDKQSSTPLENVTVGLSWDANVGGASADLDASALVLGSNGKVRSDSDFVFYNNLALSDGSVTHSGDNLTGDGDGDDEQIVVNLKSVATDVDAVAFIVSIHEAEQKGQSFGQVQNAKIRIVNNADGAELAEYKLSGDGGSKTSMVFGKLYRDGNGWGFAAEDGASTSETTFPAIVKSFGVNV